MIPLFSLAGVPPLSGFVGKLALTRATLDAGAWWTAGIILAVSVLTIISMARLWDEAFWKPSAETDKTSISRVMLIPIAGLAAVTLALSAAAGPIFDLSSRASQQLLNPQMYVDAVLSGGRPR
jgi:multicomponent Na+:H+ antiporter subunit D